MKKTYILLIISSLILIIFAIFSSFYIAQSSDELLYYLNKIETTVSVDNEADINWQAALNDIESHNKTWQHYRKTWPFLVDHKELTNIDTEAISLKNSIEERDILETKISLNLLIHYIKRIPESDRVNMQNVF